MRLCVIPARSGSKRIAYKNIIDFCNKPLISYSIISAIKSKLFDYVVVSTDDEKIAQIATNFGAIVPFIRPKNLSDDYTGTSDVIRHAINECENIFNANFNTVCCLYATAPLINAEILQSACFEFENSEFEYLFSISEFDYPIQRAFSLDDKGGVKMFDKSYSLTRSQDLKRSFHDAGAFYFGKKEAWLMKKAVFDKRSKGFLLPRYLVCDIDTPEDLKMAEILYKGAK